MESRLRSVFFNARGEVRAVWRVLAFVPLFLAIAAVATSLIVSMGRLPGFAGEVSGAGGTLAGAVGGGMILLAFVDRRRVGALGFAWTRRTGGELLTGILVGGGALAVVVGVGALAGRFSWTPDRGTAFAYGVELSRDLLIWGVAAAAEEALFRGYPFQVLVQGLGAWPAILLTSGGFALAHWRNPNIDGFAMANIFLAGILLSVAYLRTRSLWFATAVHLGWNWTMGTVLALPVSGLVLVDTPLYDGHPGGPAWLTGGRFGPEGGLAATLAFGLALAVVLVLPLREASRMRGLRPLVDSRLGSGAPEAAAATS